MRCFNRTLSGAAVMLHLRRDITATTLEPYLDRHPHRLPSGDRVSRQILQDIAVLRSHSFAECSQLRTDDVSPLSLPRLVPRLPQEGRSLNKAPRKLRRRRRLSSRSHSLASIAAAHQASSSKPPSSPPYPLRALR